LWKIILLQKRRENEERTVTVIVTGIVIGMEGVTYPHEYACPDSETLCNRMVRIHRRAKLPLNHSTTRQDKTGCDGIRQRMLVGGVTRGMLTDKSHGFYV
jgi:hypothetical protein